MRELSVQKRVAFYKSTIIANIALLKNIFILIHFAKIFTMYFFVSTIRNSSYE